MTVVHCKAVGQNFESLPGSRKLGAKRPTHELTRLAETSPASTSDCSAFFRRIPPDPIGHAALGDSRHEPPCPRLLPLAPCKRPTLWLGRERPSRSERCHESVLRHVWFSRSFWGFRAFRAAIKKGWLLFRTWQTVAGRTPSRPNSAAGKKGSVIPGLAFFYLQGNSIRLRRPPLGRLCG